MAAPELVQLFLTGILAYFLWGIYTMVFGTCIYILRRKTRQTNVLVHLVSTSLLFVLASVALAFSTVQICLQLGFISSGVQSEEAISKLIFREFVCSTGIEVAQLLSTVIAEMILVGGVGGAVESNCSHLSSPTDLSLLRPLEQPDSS
ncbi:hypothetical protein D9758_012841 [Tetrapyrgos nigripes]|uniref:Uncharacterized protein n=1 Tax=Tetrapyrgos nigripes TaxID=182062 RepID=A0A8H5FIA7_9AGAR|nr:hypothetical protein D9758_012841 [Tetrapyrgos nigripes]